MKILILYTSTAVVFFTLDAIGLRILIKPVFDRHISHLYADPFRVVPIAVFYLGYVAGMLWLVSLPALRAGEPWTALICGVVLGLMAYGTYEFTNFGTLRDWSMQQVAVDTIWGGVLTGVSALVGVTVARYFG